MAESVDALVSNTSEVKLVPVRPRLWVLKIPQNKCFEGFYFSKNTKIIRIVSIIG
jgi:hypothetical protein